VKGVEGFAKAGTLPSQQSEEEQAIQEQMRLAIEESHQKELSWRKIDPQYSFREAVYNKSKHFDTVGWALGLKMDNSWDDRWNPFGDRPYSINDPPGPKGGVIRAAVSRSAQTRDNVLMLRANNQANWEKIDKKITDLLKSNGIVLGEKDKLTFKVNQRGEITVGNEVNKGNEGTRKKIEKLLNNDKSLAQDLLYAHAERRWSVMRDGKDFMSLGDERQYDGRAKVERYILTDKVLRQEYGVSLSDIQDGNHVDLLEKLHNEERMFYNDIESALKSLEENDGDFEVKFAYKNGITIESGITDQSAMDDMGQILFSSSCWAAWGVKSSVTLDPTGRILNAQVTDIGEAKGFLTSEERTSLLNRLNKKLTGNFEWAEKRASTSNFYNDACVPTQLRLQQYAFDSQRLFQFNTGADADTAKKMNVTFNATGVSW
jgi:hypothetical protein